MAELLGSLLVRLGLESGAFKSGLDASTKQFRQAQKQFEKIGASMADVGRKMTLGITLPMAAMAAQAVRGALEQRAAMGQVESALASMGNASGKTADQLAKAADAMEMHSLFAADEILTKVTANLLTFGNVAGEQFDRAQQAAIDMATRMGGDPQSAAIMLGKALNSPIQGITALTRVGVQFTAAQKAQIEAFTKTGQVARAQGIILGEVERQFAGAAQAAADTQPWRQAQVAIDQAMDAIGEAILPVIPKIVGAVKSVAEAFLSLSPSMQKVVFVTAGVAAAFGPVVTVVGQLTIALASKLAPALLAMQARLAAVAAAEVTMAGASVALATALRGLLIATGIGIAITALAGGIYLFTNRTREAVPASHAYSRALSTAEQTARDAKVASDNLAGAMGREREAALKAAMAQRELAAQRLRAAQTRLLQAETDARAAVAEAKRTAALASGGGPGEGIQGRVSSSQERFNNARRQAGQAVSDAKAAEAAVITLLGAKAKLDRDIAAATAPINLPTVNTANIDAGTKAVERTSGAVGGLGKVASNLQEILDRLFPAEAKAREANETLGALKQALDRGKISAERYSDAIAQLWRNFLDQPDGWLDVDIAPVDGTKSLEEISADISDRMGEAFGKVGQQAAVMKVQVIESVAQMVEGALSELDRFVRGIKSGNFFDIIGGIFGALDKFGSIFTGGKGFSLFGMEFGKISGALAEGGPAMAGRSYLVGEEGPEIFTPHISGSVIPNDGIGRGGGIAQIVPSPYFDVIVNGHVMRAGPGIAEAGAARAHEQSAFASNWKLA
ncbi:phage tail length tape measure family protein [Sphingopyxis macrogoltabida]|uniref:Bacteriophage tail tape measure N-terminal domain-containing protein n=1 Tax=Sphingopyxis macrogoltabida TaxID=33050 RepID=A0AAC8Z203_SPHMC|nr:phage tail length tape measure family protein [Sphingopyxis macrogoltabida]ALJ14130.1 hypothetical protein LH19_14750 [Sphingopyxis macrogoltabida]AMU90396.1 hypothetical protein ATM17_15325 [Sphingopyxis macrogoltabida]